MILEKHWKASWQTQLSIGHKVWPHISLFWADWDTHQEHEHYPSLRKGWEASWEEEWTCLFDLSLEHNFTHHLFGAPLVPVSPWRWPSLLVPSSWSLDILSHLVRRLVLHHHFTPWGCWKWERPCIGMTCWSIAIISVAMVPWHISALHVQPRLHCFVGVHSCARRSSKEEKLTTVT